MSKAGQRVFTGITAQADIALLYLLQNHKKPDFQEMIIEGDRWEDFTILYTDQNENFEVKWHSRAIGLGQVKGIVEKELTKSYGQNDSLTIVVRKLRPSFRDFMERVKGSFFWYFEQHPYYQDLLERNWSDQQIRFLFARTNIIELDEVYGRILEYFTIDDPYYLSPEAEELIVEKSFRKIMEKGCSGGSITKEEFQETVREFQRFITDHSESFSTEIPLKDRIYKLQEFLTSEDAFQRLNQGKFLSPISSNPRHIFYIVDRLRQSDFHVRSFQFFIEKILLKKFYVRVVMQLLEKKWKEGRVEPLFLLKFLCSNYRLLFYDYNYDQALAIIREIAEDDEEGEFEEKILGFLKLEVLVPFEIKRERKEEERGHREEELVAGLVGYYYERASDRKPFIEFVFSYFDFTSDDFDNLTATHPRIYQIVVSFIKEDPEKNFDVVVEHVGNQFDSEYGGRFTGYEWVGSGVGQMGSCYSITDRGVVRILFAPLFESMYEESPVEAWGFFTNRILGKGVKRASRRYPIFLKRALIGVLFQRIEDSDEGSSDKSEALKYLISILQMKKGIPNTSEVIFNGLRGRKLLGDHPAICMELIKADSVKYRTKSRRAGLPTSLLVLEVLIQMIASGYEPAKRFFLGLVGKSEFFQADKHYDTFELLAKHGIPESDPDYVVEVFGHMKLREYLKGLRDSDLWDKGQIITGIVKRDWKDGANRGEQIIEELLESGEPKSIEFVNRCIDELTRIDSYKTYLLIKRYLRSKAAFWKAFGYSSHARSNIVNLGENLVKEERYDEAKKIVSLCLEDPDPETSNEESQFNYHLHVKQRGGPVTITSVRGKLAWLLHKVAVSNEPKLMKYALEKLRILLDLDGSLARKLGYPEPDYYVRLQALAPLTELAHFGRRILMSKFEEDLGNEVKLLASEVMDSVDSDLESGEANPAKIVGFLARMFCDIMDLDTDEAIRVIDFFETHEQVETAFMLVYFAEFRERQFQDIPFEARFFKDKLREVCSSGGWLSGAASREFWMIARSDERDSFGKIEEYWRLLFSEYEKEVWEELYRTLKRTILWPGRYQEHRELFEKAVSTEFDHLASQPGHQQIWGLDRDTIFKILHDRSVENFIDAFEILVGKLTEYIHYTGMSQLLPMFKAIDPTSEALRVKCQGIRKRLIELYPEDFEDELNG